MNRTILITGATSGIGEACARLFAQQGNRLILTGRRSQRLQGLKKEIEEHFGIPVFICSFDIRNRPEVQQALATLPTDFRTIDVLINNAGLAAGKENFADASVDDWEQMIETNILGLLYATKEVLPMLPNETGHIINIGSIAGDGAYPGGSVYCATKAAVDILSQAMRIDLLQRGIKVTNIKPGATETEFSLVRFKGDTQQAANTYSGYRPLTANEVANAVLYCANLPAHVCVNELTLTCTAQANSHYIHKR